MMCISLSRITSYPPSDEMMCISLSRITSYPPSDEMMAIDEDLPPGFSSPSNALLVTIGPSAAINQQEVEIHTNQDHQDSRTRYSLAGDEKMNTDEDISPGFSSPCNALMVPSGPSSSSINHQKRDVHAQKYIHSKTTSNMTVDEDAPPWFSSPCNGPTALPGSPSIAVNLHKRKMDSRQNLWDVVCGESQLKFLACKPLAYGISYSAVQQFGVLKEEGWSTAPGVPFHPFPQLPPYGGPKDQRVSTAACPPSVEGVEKSEQSRTSSTYPPCQNNRATWGLENNPSVADDRSEFQLGGSYNLGRKFFRQQKWNQPKTAPPWVRMRNGLG